MRRVRATLLALLFLGGCTSHEHRGIPAVRLSVKTNPPTMVTVVPPPGSGRAPIELGRSPLDEATGVFVGDTIRLVNVERGISYEEVIEYGSPGELKLISKVFR
jgi:hypothetical protein